jgi:CHAT domain-containing protein
LFLGTSLVYLRQPAQGEALIEQVAHSADTVRHAGLAGRAYWSLGTTYLRAGGYAGAMTALHRAGELFGRIGERQNRGAVAAIEAEGHFDIGDAARGSSALHTALVLLRPHRQSVWLHNALWLGARESARAGYVAAASRFEAEDVRVARNSGLMAQVVEAHLSRARVLHAASADDSAASELAAARLAIRDVPPDLQPWLRADLRLSEAEQVVRSDPARAVAALDSVVTYFGSDVRHPVRLIPALLARSQALMGLHDADAATRDLSRAIDLIDARQDSIADLPDRAQLLESARGTFDRIVMLIVSNGRGEDALAFMERGRAVLRRAMGTREASVDAQHARAPTPAGAIDVDYALVGDTLLTWVVAGSDVRFTRDTIDRRALRGRIDRVRTALELGSDQSATTADLAGLYDVLIRPIAGGLRDAAVLVVVPDAELGDVPYPALLDTVSRTFLVERYPLRIATSLVEARRASRRGAPDGRAVFVVDPAFDPRAFRGLRYLAGAAREVRTIAPLYPTSSTLAGAWATPRAFESAMAAASVVHYAGHSLFDDERPERSVLVLASDVGARERGLTAERISHLQLEGVRLVVLSACETLRTSSLGSNGFTGLAGAFLAAGAGGVVGTLWRVDDAMTPDLMFEFHRAFRASGDASAALREAQMAFLRSPDAARRSPAAWAGFRYVGT